MCSCCSAHQCLSRETLGGQTLNLPVNPKTTFKNYNPITRVQINANDVIITEHSRDIFIYFRDDDGFTLFPSVGLMKGLFPDEACLRGATHRLTRVLHWVYRTFSACDVTIGHDVTSWLKSLF